MQKAHEKHVLEPSQPLKSNTCYPKAFHWIFERKGWSLEAGKAKDADVGNHRWVSPAEFAAS
jgi:hypothetical protein